MNSELSRSDRRFSWPLAFTLIAVIVAALSALILWRVETWPARTAHQTTAELEHVAGKVRDTFIQIARLQPRITVNDHTYIEHTTQVAELAILSRQIEVEHEMMHTWAGSTKRVKLHGTFAARAGFDLQNDVSVKSADREITITLPHAKILGVEQKQVEVLELENGLWNRVSAADLESELAILPTLARQKAVESGLAAEADATIQRRVESQIDLAKTIRVIFRVEQPKS